MEIYRKSFSPCVRKSFYINTTVCPFIFRRECGTASQEEGSQRHFATVGEKRGEVSPLAYVRNPRYTYYADRQDDAKTISLKNPHKFKEFKFRVGGSQAVRKRKGEQPFSLRPPTHSPVTKKKKGLPLHKASVSAEITAYSLKGVYPQ